MPPRAIIVTLQFDIGTVNSIIWNRNFTPCIRQYVLWQTLDIGSWLVNLKVMSYFSGFNLRMPWHSSRVDTPSEIHGPRLTFKLMGVKTQHQSQSSENAAVYSYNNILIFFFSFIFFLLLSLGHYAYYKLLWICILRYNCKWYNINMKYE